MQHITEQSTTFKATLPGKDATKKQEVFYNPVMKSNRDISITLLNCVDNKEMNIALPLAGSGIRGIRFLQELNQGKLSKLFVNDKNDNFVKTFTQNLGLNKLKQGSCVIKHEDAELFLLKKHDEDSCGYFDYIDIDPFGTPNPFLSSAVNKIKRKGILAITATDTAALTGTYAKVTRRKYWSTSMRNHLMHEIGLRILIRKIQLQGVQYDKALIPMLAYWKDHYFRIYFRSEKGKEKCDAIIKQHQYFLYNAKTSAFEISNYNSKKNFDFAGPLWVGELVDKSLLKQMVKENQFETEQKFLELILEESKVKLVGFYDIHALCKKYKKEPPKMDFILKKLKGVRTHFSPNGIKTKKSLRDVLQVLKG